MPKIPAISVAIPTYNREEVLVNTIKDVLLRQTFKDFELLVIDQSAKHNTQTEKFLKSVDDPRFRYFRTTPPSLTAARNFALDVARAPYILFLDDDVILDKNLLSIILKTFRERPNISAVAGRIMQDGFPVKKDVLRFDEYAISHGVFTASEPGYTNSFPGGNHTIRVAEAKAVGGYDTRYRGNAFREESDMALRFSNLGYKIYFEPKASLLHLAAPYGGLRVKTHIYDNPGFYRNELFFTLKFAQKGHKIEALRKKYHEYCLSARHMQAYKRRYYFISGFVAAIWRILFGKQIISREAK